MSADLRPLDAQSIAAAAELLAAGDLVAFPTETVYGLGADATDDRAVARIFEAKGRPRFNPLISHFATTAQAEAEAIFDDRARRIAERYWPGPLTLVLPRRPDSRISLLCSAGLDSLAIRVPAHPGAHSLLTQVGRPVAAPSANRSGQVSPTIAAHVVQSLGAEVTLVLDGGSCEVGLESTVLDLSGETPAVLRPGAVTAEEIAEILGPLAKANDPAQPKSPGQLASHYAPALPVRLAAARAAPGEALLAFGAAPETPGTEILNLSAAGDLREAAANLFAYLRRLDRPEHSAIAVMPIPEQGLGVAINDRLRRAAAPRPT